MNGEQARMLRLMRADVNERRRWSKMTAFERGYLRRMFESCEWCEYPNMEQCLHQPPYWPEICPKPQPPN